MPLGSVAVISVPVHVPALSQMQKHIADSYAEYMAGKHYVYGVAANLDLSSTGNGLDADGTKLYCTTMAKNVADRAMQVGYGTTRVPSCVRSRIASYWLAHLALSPQTRGYSGWLAFTRAIPCLRAARPTRVPWGLAHALHKLTWTWRR